MFILLIEFTNYFNKIIHLLMYYFLVKCTIIIHRQFRVRST